jgi:hypothetical protein
VAERSRRVGLFIAGVQKGGTTALDAMLREQPSIRMARRKEPHFFDNESVDWSNPDFAEYHRRFDFPDDPSVTIGEATPAYTFWPNSIGRIASYNPDARIVVCLRHPAYRALSHWRMAVARHVETRPFMEAIRNADRGIEGKGKWKALRWFSYVERGFYGEQIVRLLAHFPRERVLFLRTDDLLREPASAIGSILKLVGSDSEPRAMPSSYIVPTESRTVGAMSAEALEMLNGLFHGDILKAQSYTGLHLQDWLARTYAEPMRPHPNAGM